MIQFGPNQLLFLIEATRWTVLLSLIAFVGGGIFGLAIALMRVSTLRIVRLFASLYVQAVQGTPLLVIMFLCFFGLSVLGFDVNPLYAAGAALTIHSAAFLGEIWRGCIESVPRTQWEAARCLGFNRPQQFAYVILPQAAKISLPPTVGFMVQIVKNTSLASVIGFVELTRAGQIVNNATFRPFMTFFFVGVIYFAVCYPLSIASRRFERKLNVGKT